MERQLTDRIETYSHEIEGECICGQKVIKVIDSSVSAWMDKVRYRYPDDNTAANIFRCKNCMEVIQDTFHAHGKVITTKTLLEEYEIDGDYPKLKRALLILFPNPNNNSSSEKANNQG
jgi:hypothetical protein